MSGSEDARGAIAFAEKVLDLLDEGRYTATYKYAVLLALIDPCLESTKASGAPPEVLTTRQIAEKIVEMYWPHTVPFAGRAEPRVLRQNAGGGDRISHRALSIESCTRSECPTLAVAAGGAGSLRAPGEHRGMEIDRDAAAAAADDGASPRCVHLRHSLGFAHPAAGCRPVFERARRLPPRAGALAGGHRCAHWDVAACGARLESGTADVRLATLERHAAAVGRQLDWRLRGR